ncbi:MAG: CRTAC1 family protein [Acidobacteria bacterium]|nr:CRTAC1 family protein [Acidobacteriota bacterium]
MAALAILATSTLPAGDPEEGLSVADLGLASGFQDYWENHYRRGRSIVADDFDGDGRLDYFIGNPGDESFVFQNLGPGPEGVVRLAPAQVLLRGDLAFGASAADYDNDGDADLFVGCGGLDGTCLDFLFRNDSVPGGIKFSDVSLPAGIRGPVANGVPLAHSSGGGTWGDYDRDGDPDLFVGLRGIGGGIPPNPGTLWKNNGDGSFSDATAEARLTEAPDRRMADFGFFQNTTWIDADNDGDLDLFLNNAGGPNSMRKNLLAEEGTARFVEATLEFSLPGEDLRYPYYSFASAVADFNNDGWQDLILFAIGSERPTSPYGNGNGLFLNREGKGFFNAAARAGIDIGNGEPEVAMGCQVADLNADGIPDLAIGAGNPTRGEKNRLLLSRRIDGEGIPLFEDAGDLIDFEPGHGIDPGSPPYPQVPPYPYRGHGMAAGDVDGDGHLELGVVNGGPARSPAIVREPNRLFRFTGPGLGATFRALLRGDGTSDGRDAIGARAYVEIPGSEGRRRVFQTVLGGSGFSAQNERTLTFGLGGETQVSRLSVLWPSGCLQVVDSPPASASSLLVEQACWSCPAAPGPVQAWLDPDAYGCARPPVCRVEGTITDGPYPVPWTRVVEELSGSSAIAEARSGSDGSFALEHPYEPGACQVSILEPFGYLPVSNPVRVTEDRPGLEILDLALVRAPEARWPRGAGYWLLQAKAWSSGSQHGHEGAADMALWAGAIRARYPGLPGFESAPDLVDALEGNASHAVADRLRRHLSAALLNLASGRLSSFTVLESGMRVVDLVEDAYRWLAIPGSDASSAADQAMKLEALNEGLLFS